MGIGTSIFLFVLGAILVFAVHLPVDGVNVHALGVILMVVGALGGVISMLFWNSWGGWGEPGGRVYRREPRVVDSGARMPGTRREAVAQPVVAAQPVVGQAVPVVGQAVPVVGQAVPVDGAGFPVAAEGVPVVPVVGQGVPVVAAPPVVRRPVRVTRTTVYEDPL